MSQVAGDARSSPCLTPLDSKIIQYNYSIAKMRSLQANLRAMVLNKALAARLPLCNYITLLFSNLFAINESGFGPKLDAISNFKLFKPTVVTVSPQVSHVAYDNNDQPVAPLLALPSVETARKCLKLLDALCTSCLQGYEKRLENALKERNASHDYIQAIDSILRTSIFDQDKDIDLTISEEAFFALTEDSAQLNDPNYIEATLIDIDVTMIFMICNGFRKSLDHLAPLVNKFKLLKSASKKDSYMNSLGDKEYLMHKIVALTIRLNDMYTVLRKFGRKAYLSNVQHLNSQKFLSQGSNATFFKLQILKSMEDLFNSTKKNGVLIANLTRLIRQNSRYEVTVKNILDFSNFVNQGYILVESTVAKFEDFGSNWLSTELRFRNAFDIPKTTLFALYQQVQKEYSKQNGANHASANKAPPQKKIGSIADPFPSMEIAKTFRKLDINESVITGRVRSSSNSSVSSNNSTARPTRRGSITSTNRPTSVASPPKTPVANRARPSSMIFQNQNSSVNSLPVKGGEAAELKQVATTTTPTGRQRSNSQPQPSPNLAAAQSAARSNGVVRSPVGSVRRAPSINRTLASPTPSKVYNRIIPEEEDAAASASVSAAASAVKQLTANQRLQLHLRQASKSGTLFTQEKEVFNSVVYDPNAPQGTTITKRYTEVPPEPKKTEETTTSTSKVTPASAGAATALKSTAPKRTARDHVTRMNTKRNSELMTPSTALSADSSTQSSAVSHSGSVNTLSEVSSSASDSNTITKQVRFTGVPDYTEAEDAPTKYSAKILKNFAMFRHPGLSNPMFKRKDQLLKKEESLSFKTQLHSQAANGLSAPVATTKLGRLRDKLM